MTVAEAIRMATTRLSTSSDTARLDAEILMAHALGVSRSEMVLHHMQEAVPDSFIVYVERRAQHEPIAYILGQQEFFGLDFAVTHKTLIPRGDSEVTLQAGLDACPDARHVLDMGTGSGALLLTFLNQRAGAVGTGIDISDEALDVAAHNAVRLGLSDRVRFMRANWREDSWRESLGRFDLVLCNPPYVETGANLDPDVRNYEPASALFAGPKGLDEYCVIFPQLSELLCSGGIAVFEIGAEQAENVRALAHESGFDTELRFDLAGRSRALILR